MKTDKERMIFIHWTQNKKKKKKNEFIVQKKKVEISQTNNH